MQHYAKVAGITFDNRQSVAQHLQEVIKSNPDKTHYLKESFELDNPHDPHAVALYFEDKIIGYVPRFLAKKLNPEKEVTVEVLNVTGDGKKRSYGCNILITSEAFR